MSERLTRRVFSGTPWEAQVAYCRATRRGPFVSVAGTTASGEDGVVGRGDAYRQASFVFDRIESALDELGAGLADVVRTRMYVRDIAADWEAVGRAHAERFGEHPPASTMVEVARLIDDEHLVEIEVDAVVL